MGIDLLLCTCLHFTTEGLVWYCSSLLYLLWCFRVLLCFTGYTVSTVCWFGNVALEQIKDWFGQDEFNSISPPQWVFSSSLFWFSGGKKTMTVSYPLLEHLFCGKTDRLDASMESRVMQSLYMLAGDITIYQIPKPDFLPKQYKRPCLRQLRFKCIRVGICNTRAQNQKLLNKWECFKYYWTCLNCTCQKYLDIFY